MRRAAVSVTPATLRNPLPTAVARHGTRSRPLIGMTTRRPAREHSGVDYPELAARTRRFSYGAPRGVTVTADGALVVFLRSAGPEDPADRIWVFDVETGAERQVADPADLLADKGELPPEERALRERLRLATSGIGSYTIDATGSSAIFA